MHPDQTHHIFQEDVSDNIFGGFQREINSSNDYNLNNLDGLALFIRIISANTIEGFENELIEYLMNLPSSIDEFYKIIGEHYVSEIMRSRPDIHSPTQLMKELITGRQTSFDNQYDINFLVRQMLEQVSFNQDLQNHESNKLEPECSLRDFEPLQNQTELKDGILNENYNYMPDQAMADENPPDQQINSWIIPSQVPSESKNLRKRELKFEQKEKEQNDLSPLDLLIRKDDELNKETCKIEDEFTNPKPIEDNKMSLKSNKKQTKAKRAPK